MKIGKSYSIGSITRTKYWLSIERKPFRHWRWLLSFKPTYHGTTRGLLIGTPWFVVLGHIRNTEEYT